MSYYMIVQSDQNLEYYPENNSHIFKVKLRQTLKLAGIWQIALTEVTLREVSQKEETLSIYSNICGDSCINGVNAPLLRRVVVPDNTNTSFSSYYYIPVIKSEISELEFKLENDQGAAAEHLKRPVTLVLHFTRSQIVGR